jgi:hypothetical protein
MHYLLSHWCCPIPKLDVAIPRELWMDVVEGKDRLRLESMLA